MANDDLKNYLKERLLALDPSLDATPGGEIEREVINPLLSRLGADGTGVDISTFIVNRLQNDPVTAELDVVTSGSVLKDVLAKPLAVLLEPLQREINFLKTQQSLASADALTKAEMDALLANVFAERREGSRSFGTIQLYFEAPRIVGIDSTIIFYSSKGIKFRSPTSLYFDEADYIQSGDLYYIEFEVESLVAHFGANVPADDIKYVTGITDVVRVTNPTSFAGGATAETNEAFLSRAERSLSERSTTTKRGIESLLFSNYANLAAVDVVGFAEPEMQRDILTATTTANLTSFTGMPEVSCVDINAVPMLGADAEVTTPNTTKLPWTKASFFPFTNVLDFEYPNPTEHAKAAAKVDSDSLLRVFTSGSAYNTDLLGRVRAVEVAKTHELAGDPVNLRLILEDFDMYLGSDSPCLTHPSSNFYDAVNSGQKLRTLNAAGQEYLWRGAPLPFTDTFELQPSAGIDPLTDYVPLPGRDYLVVSGWDNLGNHPSGAGKTTFRAYPIKEKVNGTTLTVFRVDHTIINRNKVVLPLTDYLTSGDSTLETDSPEVIAMGAPNTVNLSRQKRKLGTDADAFDGVSTVSGGIQNAGGVALYFGASPADLWWGLDGPTADKAGEVYVELSEDPVTRPLGWASLGVSVGDGISLSAYARSTQNLNGEVSVSPSVTNDLPDWWEYGRIVEIGSNGNNHLIKVEGVSVDKITGMTYAGGPVGDGSSEPGSLSTGVLNRMVRDLNSLLEFSTYHPSRLTGTVVIDDNENTVDLGSNWAVLGLEVGGPGVLEPRVGFNTPTTVIAKGIRRFIYFTEDLNAAGKPDYLSSWETPNAASKYDGVHIEVVSSISAVTFTEIKNGIEKAFHRKSTLNAAADPQNGWDDLNNIWKTVSVQRHPSDGTLVIYYMDPTTDTVLNKTSTIPVAGSTVYPDINFSYIHTFKDSVTTEMGFTFPIGDPNQPEGTASSGLVDAALGIGPKVLNVTNRAVEGDSVVFTCQDHGLTNGDYVVFKKHNGTDVKPAGWTAHKRLVHVTSKNTFAIRKTPYTSDYWAAGDLTPFYHWPSASGFGLDSAHSQKMPFPQLPAAGGLFSVPSGTGLNTVGTVENFTNITSGIFYSFPRGSRFRLHFTVYKAEVPTYLPNGNLHVSYTDLAYAPAYDVSGKDNFGDATGAFNSPQDTRPHVDYVDTSTGTLHKATNLKFGSNLHVNPYVENQQALAQIESNANWAIIRLRDDFTTLKLESGNPVTFTDPGAEVVTLAHAKALQKYPEYESLDINIAGTTSTANRAYTPLHSPFSVHGHSWSAVGTDASLTTLAFNAKGLTGFSLSTELGAHQTQTLLGQTFSPIEVANVVDTAISVSGIPGAYPFTTDFIPNPPLLVSPNQIHLGGMTDVYIKELSSEEAFSSFEMTSKFISKPEVFGSETTYSGETVLNDIVATASDGIVHANNKKLLFSTNLTDPVSGITLDDLVATEGGIFFVLHIVDSVDGTVKGKTFEVAEVSTVQGYVRTKLDLNTLSIDTENVEYRLLRSARCRVDQPRIVKARGLDAIIDIESSSVKTATKFKVDTEDTPTLSMEILTGENKGVYPVTSITEDEVVLNTEKNFFGPESGIKYEIFEDQGGLDLPLINIESLELSSADGTGLKVPYRKSIGVVAESFSGLNNDPITVNNQLVLRKKGNYIGDNAEPAHTRINHQDVAALYHTDSSFSWTDRNITKYDVIKLSNQEEEYTYWYVTDIYGVGGNLSTVLLLDRASDLETTLSNISGTIGKPQVGDVKMYFLQPTYVSVGPDTVLTTADNKTFRPSPAEQSLIYQSGARFTDITIDPDGAGLANPSSAVLSSGTVDFGSLRINTGDRVTITKKVLIGGPVNVDLADELTNKTLIISVDGVKRTVVFTSTGTLSINQVASQINSSLGDALQAKVSSDNRLKLYSSDRSLVIQDSSSGVLVALNGGGGASLGDIYLNSNNSYGSGVTLGTTVSSFATGTGISNLIVVEVSATSGQLEVDVPTQPFAHPKAEVFISVERPKYQAVFPAGMTPTNDGLYYFSFVASSREPLGTDRVLEDTPMTATVYDSLGYCLHVENQNYSYSMAEHCEISVTPYMLSSTATDFSKQYILANSRLDAYYTRSPIVESAQALLLSENERVVCNNPLTRHFLPAYLYLNVQTFGGSSATQQKNALVDSVNALYPNRTFTAFDIESTLISEGVDNVVHPITLNFVTYNADRSVTLNMTKDSITLDKKYHVMDYADGITVSRS